MVNESALAERLKLERALGRVVRAIRSSLDLDHVFSTAAEETGGLLPGVDCFVFRRLEPGRRWRCMAQHRPHDDAPGMLHQELDDADLPFPGGLLGPRLVSSGGDRVPPEPEGEWLALPLAVEERLWGALVLRSADTPSRWTNEHREAAQAVAQQLEVAIQQAALYQRSQVELAERRRVEKALEESEVRFEHMAANVPGALWQYLLRPDGSDAVPYLSRGGCELWEVEATALTDDGTPLWRRVHPDDRDGLRRSVERSARDLSPWTHEWRITTPSGRVKWLQAWGRPRKMADGGICWDTLALDVTERRSAQEALRESEQRFRHLFEGTPRIAVQGYDTERKVIFWNPASEELYGYTREEALGQRLEQLIIPAHMRPQVVERIEQWLQAGEPIPAEELNLIHKEGRPVAVFSSHLMMKDASGRSELYCIDIDLGDLRQTEEALHESEARYRLLAENTNDLVCLHAPDGHFEYVSPSCQYLLGFAPEELLGRDPYDFFHPDDRELIRVEAHHAALNGEPRPVTYRMLRKTGDYIWFETLTRPITDPSGRVVRLQTTSRDVTERVEAQERLRHDALHDTLTGLPNRSLLMERLELALHQRQRNSGYNFAVLFLDVDRFKVINDSLGHLVGDEVLVEVSNRIVASLRATDLAARLGGDEFVVFLDYTDSLREVVSATQRIVESIKAPLDVGGRETYLSASIGIVLGNAEYSRASQLLRDADIAMYQAKAQGRDRYAVFDAGMHVAALERLQLENDLRRALDRGEFVLFYQPIVSLEDGRVVGFESLVRWQHPEKGLCAPNSFIPLAEETGMVTALDEWGLESACAQLARWQQAHPDRPLRMHVNLSAQDLRRRDLNRQVAQVLERNGLDPGVLVLEITESMVIEDVEAGIVLLEGLRAQGVRISLDDFGTGYSSLRYLQRLPVDTLKVDRSFVSDMETSPHNRQIVEIIHLLGSQLGLSSVAEGIETPGQLHLLRALGYGLGQGYLFSRPRPAQEAEGLIDQCFTVEP